MALISSIGKSLREGSSGVRSVSNIVSPAARRLGWGAALGAAAVSGFASGFSSSAGNLSDIAYETLTGSPDTDNYVFGTDVGIRRLMAPMNILPRPTGGVMGALSDPVKRQLLTNGDFYGRLSSASRGGYFDNRMPTVDGSIVFGSYQHRGRS